MKKKGREMTMGEEKGKKGGGFLKAVKEFVYGIAAHDSARFALKTRASMEHLFILITMGDMLGVPILPPIIPSGFCRTLSLRSRPGKGEC